MEKLEETEPRVAGAQATERWFREFVFDDDKKPGRIDPVMVERLRVLFGKGNKTQQIRTAADTIFQLKDSDEQATFAMYICGYDEQTIGAVAIADLEGTLASVREIVGPLPEEKTRRARTVGRRAIERVVRSPDFETNEVETDPEDEDFKQVLTSVRLTQDPVYDYLRTIGKHELLKAEDEVELAKAIEVGLFAQERLEQKTEELSATEKRELKVLVHAGKRAYERMVTTNLRLVVSIAKRYQDHGMAFMDLIQEGNLGLDRAVQKFDYQKGFKLSTYATNWIKQSITRALADQSRLIRLPVHKHEVVLKAARTSSRLEQMMGVQPTDEEVAAEMEIDVETLRDILAASKTVTSLNAPLSDDGATEFGDLLADTTVRDVDASVTNMLLKKDVSKLIGDTLDHHEAEVIKMRFGIGFTKQHSLDEIGNSLSVSREHARQLETRAMKKLRSNGSLYSKFEDYLSA